MKPKIPQQLFKNESAATPLHDEMLLLFSKHSIKLKQAIFELNKQYLSDNLKDFTQELGLKKDEKGFTTYDISYNKCDKYDKLISYTYKHNETKLEIDDWTPEKPIIQERNNYYIGSVDLFVSYRIFLKYKSKVINYNNKQIKFKRDTGRGGSIIFEFKPQIKSFSEVIRQVKVYEKYLPCSKSVVITYSDISRFKDVFESQGIGLIQLPKKENKNQTKL